MLFETEVTDIGIKHIGDSLLIVKPENGIAFKVRVEKIDVNLHNPEVPTMELGDYEYFQESKAERSSRLETERFKTRYSSVISQMKRDFDARFDSIVEQWVSEHDQLKIDLSALIEQHRLEMTNLFETTRTEMEEHFNAEVDRAYEEAETNYGIINERITTEIDTARHEINNTIDDATNSAIAEAERIAQEKADKVQYNLTAFENSHSKLVSDMSDKVINIENFIGDTSKPLNEYLYDISQSFEDKINNISTWHYNLLRDSRFTEIPYPLRYGANTTRETTETIAYYKFDGNLDTNPGIRLTNTINLQAGKEYTFSIDYRTDSVVEIDRLGIFRGDGTFLNITNLQSSGDILNLKTDGQWNRAYLRFTISEDTAGRMYIGTIFSIGNTTRGIIDIRLPYLTETKNVNWMYHQSDDYQNIEEVINRVTYLEDGYQQMITRNEFNFETGEISGKIRSIESDVGMYSDVIANHENWIVTNGSSLIRTADLVESKIWLTDIQNPNLIPNANFTSREARGMWKEWGTWGSTYGGRYLDYAIVGDRNSSTNLGIISPRIGSHVTPGEVYTLSFEASAHYPQTTSLLFNYLYITNIGDTQYSFKLENPEFEQISTGTNVVYRKYKVTFTMPNVNENSEVLIGTNTLDVGINAFFRIRHPKLELGRIATPFINSFSMLEQKVNEVNIAVQGIEGDFITQNDIIVDTNRILIGSQQIGGNNLASILAISPSAMDIITESLNITGNVNVKGKIESLAISAVSGEFSSLFSAQVKAGQVHADYVEGFSAKFSSLYTLNANIERLVAQYVFTDAVTTKSLSAIEANIGRVRTAFLKADVINGTHIASNTISVQHLTGYDAILTTLMARNVFADKVMTLSLDAVDGNISNLRSKIITTGIIEAKHLKADLALVDRVFATTAMIERLTAKTAFLRDIRAITIDAVQINLETIMNSAGKLEGGITVRRPDGAVYIQNGVPNSTFDIQFIQPRFMGVGVDLSANYFRTSNTSYTTAAAFSYMQAGRYLTIEGYCEMRGSTSGSSRDSVGAIRLMEYSGGTRSAFTYINSRNDNNDSNQYFMIRLDLGTPSYIQRNFYVQFYTASNTSDALFRINQAYYHG